MQLSLCTDSLGHLTFTDMLDYLLSKEIYYVELATGGWSPAPHINLDELLTDESKRQCFLNELDSRGMKIAALNCSGNPLWPGDLGKEHRLVTEKTMQLAGKLGVEKVVMMSGLPGACAEDKFPNWICYTQSWPPILQQCLDYQWNDVAIPYWQNLVVTAKSNGVKKIALENFSSQLVYNCDTLFKLRNAVDPIIGLNLDPSHLIWMGADPIACARELGDAIHHVHGKDTRIEKANASINTVLDNSKVDDVAQRSWNYVAVGFGQDLQWWKEFFSTIRMVGYNDIVSLEMEDLTMDNMAGVEASIKALKQCVV